LLKSLGNAGLHELFKGMEQLRLVETVTDGDYPLMRLTEEGMQVMRRGGNLRMRWPDPHKPAAMLKSEGIRSFDDSSELMASELGFDEGLFDKLKKKRLEISQRDGIPAYMVFPNKTLEFFTRLKPKSYEDGMKIRGVGEAKAGKYLKEFLPVIQSH